jgi:CRISPR-associated protein Csb1
MNISADTIKKWATDSKGPVALHLKQTLTSVECIDPKKDRCIIYPPTYADIGYNIDELADGTKVALVDSVGSQANRMEPFFICSDDDPSRWLVPQIKIKINDDTTLSLLELAHRGADAVVRSSGTLSAKIDEAFQELKKTGDASKLCAIAPTSLLFGVWDSRGSNEKLPRLVRSIIRAWDVEVLHSAAQFNSVWKGLNDEQKGDLDKEAKKQKVKLSVKGFADAPGVFRDTKVSQLREGSFNPEARVLGGILVKGGIERNITINLVALRGLSAGSDEETQQLRTYLLNLALVAATAEIDLFLREGCNLRFTGEEKWHAVPRRGEPMEVELNSDGATKIIGDFAEESAKAFRAKWKGAIGEEMNFEFDLKLAKELLKKKTEDDQPASE